MAMTLNDIIRYRGRSFQLSTSSDPATSMITAILSLDHRVVDTYIADGSQDAPPTTDPAFQAHLDDTMNRAHRHLHQALMDGDYDEIIDSFHTPEEASPQRRRLSSEEFVAVNQGPEVFATPTRELPVLNTISQRLTSTFEPLPPSSKEPAAARVSTPSAPLPGEVSGSPSSSFPRLSAEPSEAYDSSPGPPDSPNSTHPGSPSATLTAPPASEPAPSQAQGPHTDLFAWAEERRLEAATWTHDPHNGWTPLCWTTETSPPLVDQQQLSPFWQRWSHHLETIAGDLDGRLSVLVQQDQALLIVHNACAFTVTAVPLKMMGLAINAAHRILDPS